MLFSGTMLLTDLDGTLLDSSGAISRENREAAEYYTGNGGLFSVATGRSLQGMHYFVPQLPINAPGVIFNGSMAYDFMMNRPLFFDPLPAETLAMMDEVAAAFPQVGIELYTQSAAFVVKMSSITQRHLSYVNIPIVEGHGREIPTPWVALVMTHPREGISALAAYIHKAYPELFFLQPSLSEYLEVQNKYSNKGACALRLCRTVSIDPDNLYVIGDGTNDIQLLSCTKNRYAPANAVPQIMDLSPRVVADNDNHAIAHIIDIIEKQRKGEWD